MIWWIIGWILVSVLLVIAYLILREMVWLIRQKPTPKDKPDVKHLYRGNGNTGKGALR